MCSISPPRKLCCLQESVEKYSTARQATDENMAHTHCKMDNWGYRHTPKICNTYCFSMTLMIMRIHFNLEFICILPVMLTYCDMPHTVMITTPSEEMQSLNFNNVTSFHPTWSNTLTFPPVFVFIITHELTYKTNICLCRN